MATAPANPHGPLRELAPGLHVVEGKWRRSPLARRMTVMQGPSGGLAVHSAIALEEETARELDAIGPVRWIFVPNTFHCSDADWHSERHPAASVLVPRGAAGKLRGKLARVDGTFDDDWPAELAGTMDVGQLAGLRFHEAVFLHEATRTLVLTDLCFNLGDDLSGVFRWIMKANGVVGRLAPSRLLKLAFLADREALAQSMEKVFAWDFDRVIVSHGEVLETGGKERLRDAFAFLRR